MKSVKVFLGLLTGFATGALAGILFAPEKETKTRKELLKKEENYSGALNKKFDDLFRGITKKFEKMKGEITNYAEKKKIKSKKAEKSSSTV